MAAGKKNTVIRSVSVLAILVYSAIMIIFGENSIFDKLFTYFLFFAIIFSELLVTKTYNLCAKEEKARIAIHAVTSAAIVTFAIIMICLGNSEVTEKNNIWGYIPLIVSGLDGIATLIIAAVFKRKSKKQQQ